MQRTTARLLSARQAEEAACSDLEQRLKQLQDTHAQKLKAKYDIEQVVFDKKGIVIEDNKG